jgi:hypothetical protein
MAPVYSGERENVGGKEGQVARMPLLQEGFGVEPLDVVHLPHAVVVQEVETKDHHRYRNRGDVTESAALQEPQDHEIDCLR